MKYLLDTHAILWYAQGSAELSDKAKNLIETADCYYSIVSLWEVAIKQKLNKLDDALSILELEDLCRNTGVKLLRVKSEHIERTKTLDFIHRDPFDRLLVAIAQSESLTIITHDTIIPKYSVKTVW